MNSPIVQDFQVLEWTFRDQRNVPFPDPMIELRTQNLYKFYSDIPQYHGVKICDNDPEIQKEINRRWKDQAAKRPGLTWPEFEQERRTMVHSGCADPLRWQFNFLTFDRAGECVGGAHLGNIRSEDGKSGTGFFWLGTEAHPKLSLAETWARVMIYLLENDLIFEDGSRFDLVGFDMLGEPVFTWSLETNPMLQVILDEMASIGSPEFGKDPMQIIQVRRWTGDLNSPVE
jgi:RimJ/RimL family protein N-acetyltransferase